MVQQKKIQLGLIVVIVVFAIVCLRLWQLQIVEGDRYRKLSEGNRLRIMSTPAPRGIIYDRNGVPLVKNVPYYSVYIMRDPARPMDFDGLAALLGLDRDDLAAKLQSKDISPFVPVRLKQGLTFQDVARVEARRSDFPGIFIESDMGRDYPFGPVGGHVIGYLGKMTPAQAADPAFRNLPLETMIGQWGVEALYDNLLRGTAGGRVIEVDALGREHRLLHERPAIKGTDVHLSIDIVMQQAIEDAFGEKAGALVALKVDTGEILALESMPSFDPNLFARGITSSEWKYLMEHKKKPMLNRCLQSQYPPGSTFKIVDVVAALEEGAISPDTKINCTGGIGYGSWTFGCWRKGGHGPTDLHKAIRESCDVYFYEVGKRLGIDKIHEYATALGLGNDTGIELQKDRKGLIPSTAWKRENRRQDWYLGETFNAAIGQGYVSVTPIQLAVMTATVVNGGTVYQPKLLKDAKPTARIRNDFKPDTLERLRRGLWAVVNEDGGTARGSASTIVSIGGKTGTAQVVGKHRTGGGERFMDHAWFVAFAPVDEPEVALTAFVEHGGHGGSAAAPIAKRAIEAYFLNKAKMRAAAANDEAGPVQPPGGEPVR